MTTPTDFSTPLNALSLSADDSPLTLTSSFTLISSDHVRFSVDAALLYSTSSVLKDMLQTGTGASVCEMTESSTEVALFVSALQSGGIPEDESKWDALWKIKEKYDVPSLRAWLLAGASLFPSPMGRYAAARLLNDTHLARMAAKEGLYEDEQPTARFAKLPGDEITRWYDYREAHVARAKSLLHNFTIKNDPHSGYDHMNPYSVRKLWPGVVAEVEPDLLPSSDPRELVENEFGTLKVCYSCEKHLERTLDRLSSEWERVKGTISLF